jgi:subtilisin-like proprotein convertase family protein
MAIVAAISVPAFAQASRNGAAVISDSARQQINELLAEKASRTPAQRKMGSSLIYMLKARRGINLTPNVKMLRPIMPERKDGLVDVQIQGRITKSLITAVERAGGKFVYGKVDGPLMRALVPIDAVETLAARSDVHGIRQSIPAMTQQQLAKMRGERLRAPLASAVQKFQLQNRGAIAPAPMGAEDRGSVISQGVKAHRADEALHAFGATGAGVKIGVLSDSDDFKESAITTGDLPADTVTVPGQDGRPGAGEGTAMMEIVHDMAPGAKLFFATAFNSPESFADNIRTLRFTYGCDIIVDDVIYFFESPYEDDIIAHAVNDVVADGAMYFSSAGNQGNFDHGTSGTWEGKFKAAKHPLSTLPSGYTVHDFGGGIVSDRIEVGGGPVILHWNDPGSLDNPQASNDYDLFVLTPDLRSIAVASTDIQDGNDLPFEFLGFNIPAEYQVVIAKKVGSADRTVRTELFGGELGLSTSGGTYGHSAAVGAYSVAAVDAAEAGGGAFTGGPTTTVELFSADGNRKVFFDQDGNPLNGGRGVVRKKPDVAAADGVSTTLPSGSGLNPFFGTSAAAPHAAGVAALLKSAKPSLKAGALRSALTKSAIDIEGAGRDIDSGFGIVDAMGALSAAHASPQPFLDLGAVTATPTSGDGDPFLEPGESASLLTELKNLGGAATINLNGVLTTATPGVTITNGSSTFPSIPGLGGSAVNDVPYAFSLSSGLACGTAPEFTLTASHNGNLSPQTFTFKVQTGEPSGSPTTTSFTGPPVAIPDSNAVGANIPLVVSGASALAKLVFSIDGTSCTNAIGATTVGLDHSWVGDLVMKLTSPAGTTVTLMSRPGGTGNSGNNFCQTVLDDSGASSIQNIAVAGAPWTGTFQPASPLAAFNGEDPNGTWVLNVTDNALADTGSVRAFSLIMTGFTCN